VDSISKKIGIPEENNCSSYFLSAARIFRRNVPVLFRGAVPILCFPSSVSRPLLSGRCFLLSAFRLLLCPLLPLPSGTSGTSLPPLFGGGASDTFGANFPYGSKIQTSEFLENSEV
jgi:hypothetical protein